MKPPRKKETQVVRNHYVALKGKKTFFSHVCLSLPREPFYEFLVTSFERRYDEDYSFLSSFSLRLLTNGTDLECCSLDWLFVEGRKRGSSFQVRKKYQSSFLVF